MKHTKGPWGWQKFGDYDSLTAQHGMREIIIGSVTTESGLSSFVAMNKDGILNPIDRDHPNAKLISKSPEMLEALKWFVNAMNDGSLIIFTDDDQNKDIRDNNQDMIDKIEVLVKGLKS